jgi:hypothetical protein
MRRGSKEPLFHVTESRLRLNYRYGNFYNCPIKEKGLV